MIVWALDSIAIANLRTGVAPSEVSYQTYFWEALNRPTWARAQEAYSLAGNIVIFGFSFLIMILFAIYLGR